MWYIWLPQKGRFASLFAMEKKPSPPPLNRDKAFISRRRAALSAVVIVAALAGILIGCKSGSNVDQGTRALIDALSKQRLIEPRLSGGFKGSEFRSSRDDAPEIDKAKLDRAGDLIREGLDKGEPQTQLAYARLLLSEGKKLPEAIKYLRGELASSPESAEAHNDLGVCLMLQGKLEDALDEFEVALKYKPDMCEALFNRALCYQQLLLRNPARDYFKHAADVEQDKSWLDEIKRRSDDVSRSPAPPRALANPVAAFDAAFADGRLDDATRLAEQNSELIRTHALWDLTIQHLQSALNNEPAQAQRSLSALEFIGSVLIKRGDSVTADVATYLRKLPNSERQTELRLIRDYVETARPTNTMKAETNAIFQRLEKQFRERGNVVFEALSAFRVADYYYDSKRFTDSLGKLKQLLAMVESREWPYDRARFLNELALETSRLGQDSLAIKYFQQAVSLCSDSPELESRILQYMSFPYVQIGDLDTALESLRDSTKLFLQDVLRSSTLANLAYNYSQIANVYSLRGQHRLALLYAEQALEYSDQGKVFEYSAEYSSFVAVENARLDQVENAEANLKRSFGYVQEMVKGRPRDLTELRVLKNAMEVSVRNGYIQRALGYYDRAESLASRDEGSSLLRIDLMRGRANAYIALGQNYRAQSDLLRAVSVIESYRANIATSDQRSHFLDASHSVFDQLINVYAGSLARSSDAFEMSERSRARTLLDEISQTNASAKGSRSTTSVTPLKLAQVESALPHDLAVLEYSVTSKGTYLFLLTQSDFKMKESSVTTETLDRLTREYVSSLRQIASLNEVNEKAHELYDYLIKPIEQEIEGDINLCIVPDKALHFLPFAGLLDGSGRYLLQTHALSYAPSASVLARCLRQRKPADKLERILAVGNPEFNTENFPNLLPLTDAEKEATQSARFYAPDSVRLLGAQATEPRVRAAMGECEVAHLAVHSLVEETSPWLAALVLTPTIPTQKARLQGNGSPPSTGSARDANDRGINNRSAALAKALPQEPTADPNDGLLYLNELKGMKLPHTRLVVLSSCQSGLGQYYRGEGIVSLVRPLLAAGVPTVVASLWAVDSQATSELMIAFHKQRKLAGVQEAEALRRAQIELARSYEHPYYWAPFIVVGSNSASN